MKFIILLSLLCSQDYSRGFYKHWIDADNDGLNTRYEVLMEERAEVHLGDKTIKTDVWICPYSLEVFKNPRKLDVDHLVPLKNAHISGGCNWDSERKKAYANFLEDSNHLVAVKARENRKKGAKGPADYWPPAGEDIPEVSIWYATAWIDVKLNWDLCETDRDIAALVTHLIKAGVESKDAYKMVAPLKKCD